MNSIRHLYVHIPFCLKVCPYCSFYKEASDRNKTRRFLDALLVELDRESAQRPVRPQTIFFGGGTPSALSVSQLEYLLGEMRRRLDMDEVREWTLEMNPATVSMEKAKMLRALGVNRISMGVQSWNPGLLNVLGRVHSSDQALRSYEILREAGFENVNIDLMFAVPTQSRDQWADSLERTIALAPEHISAYCLTYEEDTAFFRMFQQGELVQDKDWDADLFELTIDRLAAAGYEQYEISNYAPAGRECRHNLAYWFGADYLGLGPSAFSTCGASRWQNVEDTALYCDRVLNGESAAGFREVVNPETRKAEAIAFGLRTNRGVARDMLHPWESTVREYLEEGFFAPNGDRIVLTRKGKLVADTLAAAFV